MTRLTRAAAFFGLLALPEALSGQVVHGTVVDRAGQPVSNVVVVLVDTGPAAHPLGRALTNEGGEFRILSPRAGTFRLRTLRIGFRPGVSNPITLAEAQELNQRIELSNIPVALDTIRVSSRNQCRTVGDSAGATFRVWEQVRNALMATSLTASTRVVNATTIEYSRTLDPNDRVADQTSAVRSDNVTQPWRAASQDSLHSDGYVTTEANGWTTFYAPGIETLLSDGFITDHCFHLVTSRNLLGVSFEPAPDRGRLSEVHGTLWLDRASAELRSLEFQYVNIPKEQAERARGRVTFARTTAGFWLLSGWRIEMPLLMRQVHEPTRMGTMETPGYVETVISQVRVRGGELISALRGRDTVWLGPRWRFEGTVTDSASDAPIAGARVQLAGTQMSGRTDTNGRFVIDRVLPGVYTLEVHTPSLDRVGAVDRRPLSFTDSTAVHIRVLSGEAEVLSVCKSTLDLPGIISGEVAALGDSNPVVNHGVEARWKKPHLQQGPGYARVVWTENSLQTRTDSTGHFTLCGVPRDEQVLVTVVGDPSSQTNLTIPLGNNRFIWVSLTLHPAQKP